MARAIRALFETHGEVFGEGGANVPVPLAHPVDGFNQLGARAAFRDVAGGPGLEGPARVLHLRVQAEDEDGEAGAKQLYLP